MQTTEFGRLTEINVRDLWPHEQYDFSNWLAKSENIELLNDILGLTLVDIIENQLETSDHNHLGQIITYASGLDAKVVVWIVKEAREEHRSAIEWLNNNTSKELNFFLTAQPYIRPPTWPYTPRPSQP